ncbi:MAG TPA: tetratricopeptide repeat protein [Verrucomicrobiae bacterium]|jgi:tetratricopeptide (TPR) repeat protein|nr:tetratricopeptide repeat protein [Verrucomicrobiae bacterium]
MPKRPTPKPARWTWLICLGLALATALAYARVGGFEFVTYDDPDFIANNPHTQAGLTAQTVGWAFRSEVARNWHPITLLTHALDCQLFGLRPGPPHLVNLLLHIANTLMLFFVLRQMTGAMWRSAFVAAFFALHPLHVESVAWVAERKDVLSALFWLLTMWAYTRYARGSKIHYGLALLFFALGLMSKPMLVTLPFVLLLLDYWPLRRRPKWDGRLLVEKIPFFALSAVDAVITYSIQQQGGAMQAVTNFSITARLENAVVSYVRYLGKMVWPENLTALYLRHGGWELWQVALAALFLLAISAAVIWQARLRPYLMVGWLWYLGALVPVIGLVQVGMQSMADRYTYLPLVGIFIMVVWTAAESRIDSKISCGAAGAALVACAVLTFHQTGYWKNSETLFQRMIAVTDRNYLAHYNLGNVYNRAHHLDDAIAQYQAAISDLPGYADAINNLGGALLDAQRYEEALAQYRELVRVSPDFTHEFNFANALADTASARHDSALFAEAVGAYRQALALNPDSAEAHHNFGLTWSAQGREADAIAEFTEAVRLNPASEPAHFDLAEALTRAGRGREAMAQYAAAAQLNPARAASHNGLGLGYAMRGDMANATLELKEAVRLQPEVAGPYGNLANALAAQNKFDEALTYYAAALKLNPADYQTEFNLGLTLFHQGKTEEARAHFRNALKIKPDYSEARRALQQIP